MKLDQMGNHGAGRVPPIARVRSAVNQFGSGSGRHSQWPTLPQPVQPAIGPKPNNPGSLSNPTVAATLELPIDYGKRVVGGWPGVKGEVRVGCPVVDRFGERLLIYREAEGGVLKSKCVGSSH